MQNDAIREYLNVLMAAVADGVNYSEIIESEEGPALVFSVDSPFGEKNEIGYQFTLTSVGDGFLLAETTIILFSGIEKEKYSGVNALAAKLNPYLMLGSLRLFEDDGTVMFTHGAVFGEERDAGVFTGVLGKTVTLMENTIVNVGEYIYRYLNGEKLEALLEEIDKEG